jgi:hypothetical protein
MCEIVLLILLSKKVAEITRDKGYSAAPFVIFLILAWFGGEIMGGLFGFVLFSDQEDPPFAVYLLALVGAAVGVGVTFLTVNLLPDQGRDDDWEEDTYYARKRRARRRRDDYDEDQDQFPSRPTRRRDDVGDAYREKFDDYRRRSRRYDDDPDYQGR